MANHAAELDSTERAANLRKTEPRGTVVESAAPSSPQDMLAEAVALAVRIDAILANPPVGIETSSLFRIRLARAHVLGLLDQLGEIVDAGPTSGPRWGA